MIPYIYPIFNKKMRLSAMNSLKNILLDFGDIEFDFSAEFCRA